MSCAMLSIEDGHLDTGKDELVMTESVSGETVADFILFITTTKKRSKSVLSKSGK